MGSTHRFTVIYNTVETVLNFSPVGWDARNRALPRSTKYYASFRKSTGDFEFVFDGYTLLKSIYETDGVNAEAYLRVEKYNAKTDVYFVEAFMKLDFTQPVETFGENGNGLKLALIDDKFTEMFFAREDVEIPYDRLTTLDDAAITPYADKITVFDGATITFPIIGDVTISGYSTTDKDGYRSARVYGMDVSDTNAPYTIDALTFSAPDTGAQSGVVFKIDTDYVNPSFTDVLNRQMSALFYATKPLVESQNLSDIAKSDCFFSTNGGATVTVNLNLIVNVRSTNALATIFWCQLLIGKLTYDETGTQTNVEILEWEPSSNISSSSAIWNRTFTLNDTYYLLPNQGLFIWGFQAASGISDMKSSYMEVNPNSTLLIDFAEKYQPTYCKVLRVPEIGNRIIESITGIPDAFYSEYFGRTDLGYAVNGAGAGVTVTNGKLIRGFPVGYKVEDSDDKNIYSQLTFSFNQLFSELDKVLCLGMTIKMINGILKVVVEPRSEFFKVNVLFHIGTIEAKSFSREIKKELFFNEVKVGSETGEYLEIGSLKEFNIKAAFSSCLKTMKGVYEIVTSWRLDGFGIEYARRLVYSESNTTDSKYDDYNWLFDTVLDGDGNLIQRTDEGFIDVVGIDLITTPINLDFTPKRSLLRHGWWINSGLSKYPDKYLKYNKSKITNPLSTQKTGEAELIIERDDVLNSNLGNPLLTGHVIKFNFSPTQEVWDIADADPTGLVSYINQNTGELNYCFIEDLSQDPVRNEPHNFVGLEAFPPTVATISYLIDESGNYIITNEGDKILIV